MKKVTEKEFKEFEQYKSDLLHGRIITPSGLKFICEANHYDPYKIGNCFLEALSKMQSGGISWRK